jgi:hypothetical protein
MRIKTFISFEWDTDHESEDRLEKTVEEWGEYFSGLMLEDIDGLVKRNELMSAIQYKVTEVGEDD